MNSELNNPNTGSTEFLNFSEALNHLRWGEKVARRSWDTGSYLRVNYRRDRSRIEVTVAAIRRTIEWNNNCEALLAEDWYVV